MTLDTELGLTFVTSALLDATLLSHQHHYPPAFALLQSYRRRVILAATPLVVKMASRPRQSIADSSYPESTYAETYDEGSYASSSEGGGSAMLSRRAPSIQSAMSRRRFEEYSVTEPSISE